MTRTKLTVRLPQENVAFAKRYAAAHGLTLTEVLNRFLTRLREETADEGIDPEVQQITGLIPRDVDAKAIYNEHLMEKHR